MAKAAQKVEPQKGAKPDYVARARQAPGSDYFITIGAAWAKTGDKGTYMSVKLNNLPLNFDGSFLLMKPLDD